MTKDDDNNNKNNEGSVYLRCSCCNKELNIDTTPAKSCAACKIVYYCGRKCQLYDWNRGGHKDECKIPTSSHPLLVPKISVRMLISQRDEDQEKEFQRLWNGLMEHSVVILKDLPPFALRYLEDFKDQMQELERMGGWYSSRSRSSCYQEMTKFPQQLSFLVATDEIPHTMFSKRYEGFCRCLIQHMLDVLSHRHMEGVEVNQCGMAITLPLPKRILRQITHIDACALATVTPLAIHPLNDDHHHDQTNRNSSGKKNNVHGEFPVPAVVPPVVSVSNPPLGLQCLDRVTKKYHDVHLQNGEMVLVAGKTISRISMGWIQPCPHRVVTPANILRQSLLVGGGGDDGNAPRLEPTMSQILQTLSTPGRSPEPPWAHQKLQGYGKKVLNRMWLDPEKCCDSFGYT